MSRLPLTALQAFEAVAAEQSFNGAANRLSVTPAAISQQIRSLEDLLGHALFDRSGRSVCLTAEGARLLPGVRRGFAELRSAMLQATADRNRNRNRLNITTFGSFLQRWLLPRLPEFQAAHREFDVRLSASTALVNFADGDFDAGIRFGRGRWAGLRSVRLFDEWLVPVCHPRLLQEHGLIRSTDDLQRYPILRSDDEPWELWASAAFGNDTSPLTRGPSVDDSASIVMAALRGQGLALVRWSLVSEDVAEGTLVLPAPAAVRHASTHHFVAPPEKWDRTPVRQFREWLQESGGMVRPPPVRLLNAPVNGGNTRKTARREKGRPAKEGH